MTKKQRRQQIHIVSIQNIEEIMKCSACALKQCDRKYENREKCLGEKEEINCICICQTPVLKSTVISVGTATVGIAVAAAGVTLTVLSGGVIAVAAGTAALIGVGSSLVFAPIQKKISGESMTVKGLATDVALGAAIGAVTGPIGAGGALLAEGTSVLASFGIRALAGTSAGVVSAVVQETSKLFKGEPVTPKSVGKSLAIGAVVGTVGGASAQLAYQASSQVTQEVGRVVGAVTRVGVQGASAAATDASLQYYQNKKINLQQLGLHTMGQAIVAGTAEITSTVAKGTDNYNNRISVVKSQGASGNRISVKFENADFPNEELELILEEAKPEDFIDQPSSDRPRRHVDDNGNINTDDLTPNTHDIIDRNEKNDKRNPSQNPTTVDIDNATPVIDPKIVDRTMKMAIIPETYPINVFKKTHTTIVQQNITKSINDLKENGSEIPVLQRQKFKNGSWQVTCMNEFTQDWITQVVTEWIIDGMAVKAISVDELQQMMVYEFWIEGSLTKQKMVLNRIRKQNLGLKTNKWQMKHLEEDSMGTKVAFQLDVESIKMIKDKDFLLCNVLWNEEE